MNKLKKCLIFILMIVCLIVISNKSYATTGKINSETVRVRREASTNSDIIDQLDQGDNVEILEELDGWYKVTYTNKENKKLTGYISSKLLDVEKKQDENTNQSNEQEKPVENANTENSNQNEETSSEIENESEEQPDIKEPSIDIGENNIKEDSEYEIKQAIPIKILPLINSIDIAEINAGKIKVVEIINDWCRIENENATGWVRKNMLLKSTSEANNTSENTDNVSNTEKTENTQETKIGYVSTESLKVRKEPNTNCEVIDSLIKNTQVSIIKEIEGWYEIKIGNQIGYVSNKYISNTKVAETTSRGTSVSSREETIKNPINNEQVTNKTENKNETTGSAIVDYAKKYLGYKYVSGGSSPEKGFDCSGFTQYIFKNFGIQLNRASRDQIKNGTPVERNNIQLGDIVLFNDDSNKTIGHVGIYIGDGNFIHASNPSDGVKITSLSTSYYKTRYVGARRLI